MKTKTAVLNGKPDAGNPHVRFDEGEVASAKPRCGSLLYKLVFALVVGLIAGAVRASETRSDVLTGAASVPARTPDALPAADVWANPKAAWTGPDGKRIPERGQGAVNCVWLKHSFVVPEGWEKDRLQLDFHRIDSYGILFVNGKRVGELLHPSLQVEITSFAVPGTNEVVIFGTRDYTGLSIGPETDPLRDGARGVRSGRKFAWHEWPMPAVSGPVDLIRLPRPAAVVDAFVKTSVRKWTIDVDVDLDASEDVGGLFAPGLIVSCTVYDSDFNQVKRLPQKTVEVKRGRSVVTLSDTWKDPKLWDIGQPNLYYAVVGVFNSKGEQVDTKTFRFGFREVWTEGRSVILNGHRQRFMLEGLWFGLTRNTVGLWKKLGRTLMLNQPHPNKWWYFSWWHDCPLRADAVVDICDTEGFAFEEAVPTMNRTVGVFSDPLFKKSYRKEAEIWMRRYRNNPSLLLWTISMNFINPKSGIHPDLIGQRTDKIESHRQEVCDWALGAIKEIDPTRLVYTHADGNIGDIASGNCYPNITPVQEIRDYLEMWTQKGDMPYLASEYDAVYDGTYQKAGGFPALAEIYAINRGPEAYDLLSERVATNYPSFKGGVANAGVGLKDFVKDDPVYWGVQSLYVQATDRHWRMDGATGWHYFHGGNYGKPKGMRSLDQLDEYQSGRPEWLSPNFDIHSRDSQLFNAYIGGVPRHTDQTHTYWGGTRAEKAVCLVWDGAKPLEVTLATFLGPKTADPKARPQRVFQQKVTVRPGDTLSVPFTFTVPNVKARGDYTLSLAVTGWKRGVTVRDSFDITVFPAQPPVRRGQRRLLEKLARRVVVFDPQGKSGWLTNLVETVAWTNGFKLVAEKDLLVVGREALAVNDRLPWTAEELAAGLKVVVLEQKPETFEAWGFHCFEFMPRNVFPGAAFAKDIMTGLEAGDLSYWRGSPDLLPEFKLYRVHDFSPHPKGSNRHTMASTVFAQPTKSGFLPLLVCELDLEYSPLVRYADGRGAIYFSSLDFTGRADGTEPAATIFAKNFLAYAAKAEVDASYEVKVNVGARAADTDAFLAKGGRVLNVGFGVEELKKLGIAAAETTALRPVPDGEMAEFADRRLTYFRAPLRYAAITEGSASTGGMWYRRGNEYFLQPAETGFFGIYTNAHACGSLGYSKEHLKDLIVRARTFIGERPAKGLREEMASVNHKPTFAPLNVWHVIGPYWCDPLGDASNKLAVVHSCESAALKGDLNPNYTYPNEKGEQLDFRTSARARPDGAIDLRQYFKGQTDETSIGYAVKTVTAKEAHKAVLRLGFDWYMKVYLNGELVADYADGLGCNPRANMKACVLELKKGENVITLKLRSGAGGFCFWANMSEEGMDLSGYRPGQLAITQTSWLYDDGRGLGWNYFYTYW